MSNVSLNKSILHGMLTLTAFVAVGRLVGAGKEVAVAYRFGTSEILDVYTLSVVLLAWVPTIILTLLQSALVPTLAKLDPSLESSFCREITGFLIYFGVLSTLLIMIAAPSFPIWFNLSLSDSGLHSFKSFIFLMAPVVFLMTLNSLYSMRLLAHEHHANTLLDVVPSLILLCVILIFVGENTSIQPLVVGTVSGALIHLMALIWITKKVGLSIGVSFIFKHKEWYQLKQAVSTLILGALALSLILPIDQMLAGSLQSGSISTLSYANRLLTLGLGLAITVVTRALLPVLSNSKLSDADRRETTLKWSVYLFTTGLFITLVGWYLAPTIVQVVFERGEFTPIDTTNVSKIVRVGLLQIPVLFVGTVLVQLFTSMRKFKLIMLSSIVAVLSKLFFGLVFVRFFGLEGIMLSTVAMYISTVVFFSLCFVRADFDQKKEDA